MITKEIIEKRRTVLNDTIAHFNSYNRSLNYLNYCCYTGQLGKSQGCAIGRLIDKSLCLELDGLVYSTNMLTGGSGVTNPVVFNKLPDNLKELGQDFLVELQKLHDNGYNWVNTGLTPRGEQDVEFIIRTFIDEPK